MPTEVKIKNIIFQDIDPTLTRHPITNQVAILTNERAVKQSVKNLVFTRWMEFFYRTDLYSRVSDSIFEPIGQFTMDDIKNSIEDVLYGFEPRINIVSINIFDDIDRNAYSVDIIYRIVNMQDPVKINIMLERLR